MPSLTPKDLVEMLRIALTITQTWWNLLVNLTVLINSMLLAADGSLQFTNLCSLCMSKLSLKCMCLHAWRAPFNLQSVCLFHVGAVCGTQPSCRGQWTGTSATFGEPLAVTMGRPAVTNTYQSTGALTKDRGRSSAGHFQTPLHHQLSQTLSFSFCCCRFQTCWSVHPLEVADYSVFNFILLFNDGHGLKSCCGVIQSGRESGIVYSQLLFLLYTHCLLYFYFPLCPLTEKNVVTICVQ